MRLAARRYDTQQAITLEIANGAIASIAPLQDSADPLPWIAPGFVDLQVNGYQGENFTDIDLTPAMVVAIGKRLDAGGVTSYCPTLITQSFEVLQHGLQTIAQARKEDPEVSRRVPGIHLEGPYLSPEDGPRGAHPRQHCKAPDWEEFQRFQQAADGLIRILTISPEWDSSAPFIAKVVETGVVIAIGHTKANSDQIKAAVDAGATMSTHLGNGAHPILRRHPNYIWDQLAEDRLTASIIADGHHLPPAVIKSMVRCKTPQRCVIVSDVTGLAGLKPGRYSTSLGEVEMLADGRPVVAGQTEILAGAALPISYCVANLLRHAEVDLQTAIDMASSTAAKIIGETPVRLESGAVADLVLFDLPEMTGSAPLTIRATINAGQLVHGSL